jgi:hypothetical protein
MSRGHWGQVPSLLQDFQHLNSSISSTSQVFDAFGWTLDILCHLIIHALSNQLQGIWRQILLFWSLLDL